MTAWISPAAASRAACRLSASSTECLPRLSEPAETSIRVPRAGRRRGAPSTSTFARGACLYFRFDALLGGQDPVAAAVRRGGHLRVVHGVLCLCRGLSLPRARLRERQAGPVAAGGPRHLRARRQG